ncbi:MAG: DUF1987 domain-containing protein [Bacteroidota bacterium]
MENLKIESTKYTPEVKAVAEEKEIKFYGSSYPENANEFYKPIYQWVRDYFDEGNDNLTVNFFIYYFNTSTSKCFMNLLEIIETYTKKGRNIKVNWHYSEDDDDSLDNGEKLFMEMSIDYKLIPVKKI